MNRANEQLSNELGIDRILLSIFQNRLTLSSDFEILYFEEKLPENISIDILLTEKGNLEGVSLQ